MDLRKKFRFGWKLVEAKEHKLKELLYVVVVVYIWIWFLPIEPCKRFLISRFNSIKIRKFSQSHLSIINTLNKSFFICIFQIWSDSSWTTASKFSFISKSIEQCFIMLPYWWACAKNGSTYQSSSNFSYIGS